MRKPMLFLVMLLLCMSTAYACNIPVFRYALERWRPDVCQFVIFHTGPLTDEVQEQIDKLRQDVATAGGNVRFQLVDRTEDLDTPMQELWEQSQATPSSTQPYVVVQLPHARGPITAWQGPLSDAFSSSLLGSPSRSELSRRLLAGHSIVWLIVTSSNPDRNAATRKLLDEQCQVLGDKIRLPEGIGLPGSELYSEVPLLLRFSVLELDPADAREHFMVQLFTRFHPEAMAAGEPLVVPIFGRGRALEVIPANLLDQHLIEDVATFLSGACSCQVKEQNPGFDLLLSANWDEELFGPGGLAPPPAKSVGEGDRGPVRLTIPPGRK
jgi:hypothetical protein